MLAVEPSELVVLRETFVDLANRSAGPVDPSTPGTPLQSPAPPGTETPCGSPPSPYLGSGRPGKVYRGLGSDGVPSGGIDKTVFLKAFPFPGLFGDRIFQAFDTNEDVRAALLESVLSSCYGYLYVCCRA
jgi:hypothetical protein